MGSLTLDTPLATIAGIGPKFLQHLTKLGCSTVRDLLWHFPVRYEDFAHVSPIDELEPGQQATISAIVRTLDVRRSFRRNMTIIEAELEDDTGTIKALWFNQPYLKTTLAPGRRANFSGKVTHSDRELYLSNPAYEVIHSATQTPRHTARLVPVYPETRGLTSKGIRYLIHPILENLAPLEEYLPASALKDQNLPEVTAAIHDIHFPETLDDALNAQRRWAFEDIFLLQLFNFQQKIRLAREKAPPIETNIERMKELLGELPFSLTLSQKKSLFEIIKDIEKNRPMNRLLQGDVGSGKTVVAILAALVTAENGFQSAFMAPTEVLARQHFETFKKLFGTLPDHLAQCWPIGFLTSAGGIICYGGGLEASPSKRELHTMIAQGQLRILIGTHALIQKNIQFEKLGLVIVDEQHRFGVRQRAELTQHSRSTLTPHFLSMSATPIPRTVMLTIFGNLDISTITELPSGRKKIETKIVPPNERNTAYAFIRKQVKAGRQVFVICPRIDASADPLSEVKSVKAEYEKLSQTVFPDLRVAMLHGQMKAKEKEAVMKQLARGTIDILVATSVVEVGVDVPNATIMMIEGAERFGLAQLYQFRGRVGRGEHQSYCFLFTESSARTTTARLKALLEAKNGFELAEKDLKLRGPGQFLGSAQTGIPDLAMQSLQDISLIKEARDCAVEVITQDPGLRKHPLLREKVAGLERKVHRE